MHVIAHIDISTPEGRQIAEWLRQFPYEVSFDDTNWFPISPMHHEPLNDAFSPKILEVNSAEVDLTAAFQIHKARIKTEGPAHQVRLKVTLSRPKGAVFEDTTPILEDVALKIEKKGVL